MTELNTFNKSTTDMTATLMNMIEDYMDKTQGKSNTDKALLRFGLCSHARSVVNNLLEKAKKSMLDAVDTKNLDQMKASVVANRVGEKGVVYASSAYTLNAKINKPPQKLDMELLEQKCLKYMTQEQWNACVKNAQTFGTPATTLEVASR